MDHKRLTDEITNTELPSSLQQVLWARLNAAVGAKVGLEMFTQFVGRTQRL